MAEQKKEIKTSIGGQALLEGIMMRGPKRTSMAVRHVSGEILTEDWDTVKKPVPKIWKLPLLRGMYAMVTSFTVGYKCLIRSAELSGMDELAEEEDAIKKVEKENKKRLKKGLPPLEVPKKTLFTASELEEQKKNSLNENTDCSCEHEKTEVSTKEAPASPTEKEPVLENASSAVSSDSSVKEEPAEATEKKETTSKEEKEEDKKEKKSNDALFAAAASVGSVLGVILAIVLFFWLPSQLYSLTLEGVVENNIYASYPRMLIRSLFEGFVRIALFVGYMAGVSCMKDIHRTFMYHGAEHKTIFCYEKGLPLTVENVRKMGRFHPRCGTSFMIVMMIIGIILGSFIPELHIGPAFVNNIVRSLIKLLLLPLTVGLGYEFIKYAGRHDNRLVKILSAPGLWMQRISTKEPDDGMIECAIAAVKIVIPDDGSDIL